ncbi:hypothetical protein [Dyadobacter psychrophilus]|uniref:Uncharacterized protein n=1 Tax=Dyadobacter psychrophilus TaxID=651661 RepID=A0A1T5G5C3_9BACT|nr:hypothetical protein [Dyadobacter psychrophilus]SKC03539.1 hypothetical protein SAMN05660293_03670 [Dyadobacter psychrophilus]
MKLTPKISRRTELMADAYAAYFLAYTKGAAMKLNDLQQVAEVFYNIGYSRNADKKDHIIGSREFASLFDADLNELVKK